MCSESCNCTCLHFAVGGIYGAWKFLRHSLLFPDLWLCRDSWSVPLHAKWTQRTGMYLNEVEMLEVLPAHQNDTRTQFKVNSTTITVIATCDITYNYDNAQTQWKTLWSLKRLLSSWYMDFHSKLIVINLFVFEQAKWIKLNFRFETSA